MPSVEFDTQELISLLGTDLSLDELKERIPMIGVDMESLDDEKMVVEIFPNRPDMLSIEGFAQAVRGFLKVEKGLIEFEVEDSGLKLTVEKDVKNIRPYISTAIVLDVELTQQGLIS